eukprot:1152406-Pelagomonas_calceolata.AAC.2
MGSTPGLGKKLTCAPGFFLTFNALLTHTHHPIPSFASTTSAGAGGAPALGKKLTCAPGCRAGASCASSASTNRSCSATMYLLPNKGQKGWLVPSNLEKALWKACASGADLKSRLHAGANFARLQPLLSDPAATQQAQHLAPCCTISC